MTTSPGAPASRSCARCSTARSSAAATGATAATGPTPIGPPPWGRDVDYRLTPSGADVLRELGVPVDAVVLGRRPLIRYCIDWSEQEHHLSGALGAAITCRLFDLRWLRRLPRGRAVAITPDGRAGLHEHLGLSLPS